MKYIDKTLLENEKVIYATAPHWIIFSYCILALLLALILYSFCSKLAFLIFNFGLQFGLNIPVIFYLQVITIAWFILLLIGIVTLIKAWVFYHTSEYGITSKRVIMKVGWLRRYSVEIFLDKIEAVLVRQTIPGRVFNYGNLVISGMGGTQDVFFFVPDPFNFRKQVQQQIDLFKKGL